MQVSPKEYINIKNNIYNPPNPGPPDLKNIISTTNKLDLQNVMMSCSTRHFDISTALCSIRALEIPSFSFCSGVSHTTHTHLNISHQDLFKIFHK